MVGGGEALEFTWHQSGIGDLAWSPDGTCLAYTATYDPANPDETKPAADDAPRVRVTRRVDHKWDGRGYLGDVRRHVFVGDVADGVASAVTVDLEAQYLGADMDYAYGDHGWGGPPHERRAFC
jgi:dipeptidyl aminopeptidase/acylaminoacyl peptidase